MEFDIVIATRNRRAALQLSLPLMLAQSRLPAKLILVDSSDDHDEMKTAVENILAEKVVPVRLEIARSLPGSSLQRNIGLRASASPVVFFPDDDALWFPGFADSIMAVYERDENGLIGGVGGTESSTSPLDVSTKTAGYAMEARDRLQLGLGRAMDSLEYRLFPDPLFVEGEERMRRSALPTWLDAEHCVPVPVFPGFLMSFRTEAIRKTGFDETLGRYALFEDYDASLAVSTHHLLVASRAARVFHFRSPEKRVEGVEWGVIQMLNRAYVVNKHSSPNSSARRRLLLFSYYKLLRYLVQGHTVYGRQRIRGTLTGLKLMASLASVSPHQLPAAYQALKDGALSAR